MALCGLKRRWGANIDLSDGSFTDVMTTELLFRDDA
jgi:hypothetical protein